MTYIALYEVIQETHYEKKITALIDEILDENGQVRDNATPELARASACRFTVSGTRCAVRSTASSKN
ncbi:hypothetical protein MKQ70_02550 [Chitinophaga sedimenti]|nr:hypothetical protein [Chitinophaga sedimenti]MCK7553947.1 hypothetical protein [Chitinophaga sedimenti]